MTPDNFKSLVAELVYRTRDVIDEIMAILEGEGGLLIVLIILVIFWSLLSA